MKPYWVYMTAESPNEAERIGRTLVEERLAACVNLLGPMESIYWWNEKVETSTEIAFIAKTREDLVEPLTRRVAELHSYECPCIVALPIEHIHKPFADWIADQTQQFA